MEDLPAASHHIPHSINILRNTPFLGLLVLTVILPVITIAALQSNLRLASRAAAIPATPPTFPGWKISPTPPKIPCRSPRCPKPTPTCIPAPSCIKNKTCRMNLPVGGWCPFITPSPTPTPKARRPVVRPIYPPMHTNQ